MKYSDLFHFENKVSKVSFGAGPLGGVDWGEFDKNKVMSSVSKAFELGVNLFDTADVYGLGRSESLLSQALGEKRHDIIIATKFGVNWTVNPNGDRAKTFYDSSPERVVKALENSLGRLKIDTIPLYYIHWPDEKTPFHKTAEALRRCQEEGKIQHIGLSNFSLSQIEDISGILEISAVQAQYSLIDRNIENNFLQKCAKLKINVFTYGPLAQGLLSGKYNIGAHFNDDDCRAKLPHFKGSNFSKNTIVLSKIKELSGKYNVSMSQIALRWVLENPHVSSAICGIKSSTQIEDNVSSLEFNIDIDDNEFFYGKRYGNFKS